MFAYFSGLLVVAEAELAAADAAHDPRAAARAVATAILARQGIRTATGPFWAFSVAPSSCELVTA